MSDIQLKPCPFCGGKAEVTFNKQSVKCTCCDAEIKSWDAKQATNLWNRRIEEDDSYEGTLKITPSNCRDVLQRAPRKIIIAVVVQAMEQLNKTIEDNHRCVGIIEHFERAYKTRSAQKIHAALAQVFDDKPAKGTLQ